MSTEIRVGIIGAGRMGLTHHSIINALPGVSVTAVVDPSRIMTALIAKYCGVRTYGDHQAMLAREQLDAVLLCTPPAANAEILEQLAAHGLHTFVEKPFLLNAPSAITIARRFADAGLVNQVGYVNRFNAVFTEAKRLLDAGVIGDVIRFRSEMFSPTITRETDESGWRGTHANGGGAVYEMAAHSIDLIDYLFGQPDVVTGTWMSSVFSRQVEDIVSSTLLYRDGRAGQLYVNWSDTSYRKPTNKIEVFGREGRLLADQHGMKIYRSTESDAFELKVGWNTIYITDVFESVPFYVRGMEFTAQLDHFIACIRERRPNRCSFTDGAATLGVIDRLFADFAATRGVLN